MEIRSVSSLGDASSTLTQDVDKVQNVDAFSELLAMLFSNMLIPNSNQYSLDMNQEAITDLNNTSGNSNELNNMLSIIDNLRIAGGQPKDTESAENFISSSSLLSSVLGNNSDFMKLLNLSGDVPSELKEFINNINSLSSKEAESIDIKLSNDSVDVTPEQLNKHSTASEVKAMSDILSVQTMENTTVSGLKRMSDIMSIQTMENTTVSGLKRISDILNLQTIASKTEKSSIEAAKDLNNSPDINYEKNVNDIKSIFEASNHGTNNSTNTEDDAKNLSPQKKAISTLELTNNFEQTTGLSNIKNENINNITQQFKVPESALIEKPQDIIDITIENFKTLKLPGSTEVTVKLRPEELGDISLKLVLEKGQINGSISAERKEVVFMLQNNLEQLKTDLKNNNINLNNITINVQAGEDFDRNNSRRGFSNKQSRSNHRAVQAFEEEIQSSDLIEGLNIIA